MLYFMYSFVEYAKPTLKAGLSSLEPNSLATSSSSSSTTTTTTSSSTMSTVKDEGDDKRQAKYRMLCVFNYILRSVLCQLHPFLPFETEEIFSHLQSLSSTTPTSTTPPREQVDSLLTTGYFTQHSSLRLPTINHSLIREVEDHITLVHDVRGLQKLCGDLGKSGNKKTQSASASASSSSVKKEANRCVLLLNEQAKTPSAAMLDLVATLTKLTVTTSTTINEPSQIHTPSHLPGIAVMFPIPAERKTGVMKAIQDNVRGLQKKLTQSEKKLASIERNLSNPVFLQKASPEVCERERNDRETYKHNCSVLRENVAELLEIIRQNECRVCLKFSSLFITSI